MATSGVPSAPSEELGAPHEALDPLVTAVDLPWIAVSRIGLLSMPPLKRLIGALDVWNLDECELIAVRQQIADGVAHIHLRGEFVLGDQLGCRNQSAAALVIDIVVVGIAPPT